MTPVESNSATGERVPAREGESQRKDESTFQLRFETSALCFRSGSGRHLAILNWTSRYPWIVEAALKNREQHFAIDGEAVVLGVDGVSDFNALHSRKHDAEVQLYAFDVLALGGEDLRLLPLTMRKANLARLLRGRPDGIFIAPFETGEIGPELFKAACGMGLEGLVSKRRDRRYIAGRTREWIKVKNRSHPAMSREL